jgi:nucleoid-associated protein YgaU
MKATATGAATATMRAVILFEKPPKNSTMRDRSVQREWATVPLGHSRLHLPTLKFGVSTMNAKILGAVALALVLSACGGKKEEAPAAEAPAAEAPAAPAAEAPAADAAAAPADAAAAPADAAAAPAAPAEAPKQ